MAEAGSVQSRCRVGRRNDPGRRRPRAGTPRQDTIPRSQNGGCGTQVPNIAQTLATIPGFGAICTAELAGEIGTIDRFSSEASLALYLGMANLDNSSGKQKGSKPPRQVNTRAKAAMMIAVDRHRKKVLQSQRYYEKKRAEGKKHNQAVRALRTSSVPCHLQNAEGEQGVHTSSVNKNILKIPAGCSDLHIDIWYPDRTNHCRK